MLDEKTTIKKIEWHSHRIKPSYRKVLDTSDDSTLLVAFKDGTVKEMPWTPDGYNTWYDPDGNLLGDRISNNGEKIIAWTYLPTAPGVM